MLLSQFRATAPNRSHISVPGPFHRLGVVGPVFCEVAQFLEAITVGPERRVVLKHNLARQEVQEHAKLKEIEVQPRDVFAGQEIFLAKVLLKLVKRRPDSLHDLLVRFALVARHRGSHLQLNHVVRQHLEFCHHSRVLSEKLGLPLARDVLHNCDSLTQFNVLVVKVGKVRERHAKVELFVQPLGAVVLWRGTRSVHLVCELNAAVEEHVADRCTQTPNVPVSQSRLGLEVEVVGRLGHFELSILLGQRLNSIFELSNFLQLFFVVVVILVTHLLLLRFLRQGASPGLVILHESVRSLGVDQVRLFGVESQSDEVGLGSLRI